MDLTHNQYGNMSKEELIQELADITSSFVNDINAKKAYSELQQCKSFSYYLLNRIIQQNRNAVTISQ